MEQSRHQDRVWIIVLALLPFTYLFFLTLPPPLGLGLYIANDFPAHRVWYTQMDTYFFSKGYFPLWNPTLEMGAPYLAMCFGTGTYYPLRWWTYLPTYFGGSLPYFAQYVQIGVHLTICLFALFAIMRRHGRISAPAAALGASVFLLNQCFNNFIRFPHGIEDITCIAAALYFALNLVTADDSDSRCKVQNFLALALCVGLSWMTGYGQFSYVGGLFIAIVVLIVARSVRQIVIAVTAAIVGTAAAIGSILPVYEWVSSHPLRGGKNLQGINTDGITQYLDLLRNPFTVDVHFSNFALPALWLLGIIGIVAARRSPNRRLSLAFFVGLLFLFDIALGSQGITFGFLYKYLPLFGAFNSPSKVAWLAYIPFCWFVALGADAALQSRKARRWIIGTVLLLTGGLMFAYSPRIAESGVGIWKPLAREWISPASCATVYRVLILASGLLVCAFFLLSSRLTRGAILVALCCLFVSHYGRYNTFVADHIDPQAKVATASAFPDGLLARRKYAGYLGITGVGITSDNVDPHMYQHYMREDRKYIGDDHTRFPQSRFMWLPVSKVDTAKVTMTSFGPNHAILDVETGGPGKLVYLSKYSTHWKSSEPFTRLAEADEFIQFDLPAGRRTIRMEFRPLAHIISGCASLLIVFGLAGALALSHRRRKLAIAFFAMGFVLTAALLAGALNNRSMISQQLYGPDNVSLDPTGILHASS